TSIDEYLAEHKPGDVVSGRVVEETGGAATVELGEGILGKAKPPARTAAASPGDSEGSQRADLSSLSSMLQARWKGNAPAPASSPEALRAGQVRNFRIVKLDALTKQIEVESA
ncbi:MAG: 30S ribosomal protein S1, partial [Terracidiphilus sp.]